MVAATRKINNLGDEILAKLDEKFNALKGNILIELKDQLKNELADPLKEEFRKTAELELTVSVLQHVHCYQKQLTKLNCENKQLEQYRRWLCVIVEGVPSVDNETLEEIFVRQFY